MNSTGDRSRLLGWLCFAATVAAFSSHEISSKAVAPYIGPFQISFIRYILAAAVFFALLFCGRRAVAVERRDLWGLMLCGCLGLAVSMNLMQLNIALPNSRAAVVGALVSLNPINVFLILTLRGQDVITKKRAVGLAVSLIGVLLLSAGELLHGLGSLLSVILAILTSISFSAYIVLGRGLTQKYGSVRYNAYSFLFGGLLMLPPMLLAGLNPVELDPAGLPLLAFIVLFVTVVGYLALFQCASSLGAGVGSLIYFVKPFAVTTLTSIISRSLPGPLFFAGLVLITLGAYWITRPAAAASKIS